MMVTLKLPDINVRVVDGYKICIEVTPCDTVLDSLKDWNMKNGN